MQLVRLPAWVGGVIGVALIVVGLVDSRLPALVAGGIVVVATLIRIVLGRG